jgi:solute carrier family 26 (sodium-independent sulfate anion transporter), member 11
VGLTVIPQAIAYAGVAGLPPQYGLYSSFMACFVYTAFGSVKDSAIGPTAIAAILTRENLHGLGAEFAVLLAFLSGCVELLMGILQLGQLFTYIHKHIHTYILHVSCPSSLHYPLENA